MSLSKKILLGVAIFAVIAMYGAAFGMSGHTLVAVKWPVMISMLASLLSGLIAWRVWRCVTKSRCFAWNYILHSIILCGVLLFGFYGLNTAFPGKDSSHEERVTVVRKWSEQKNRMRRVGRGRYVPGEKYTVYRFRMKFENGMEKNIDVTLREYMSVRQGGEIKVEMERGLFGIPFFRMR